MKFIAPMRQSPPQESERLCRYIINFKIRKPFADLRRVFCFVSWMEEINNALLLSFEL